MKISDKSFTKTIQLQCSIETLWKRWTTHEGLLTFFGRDNKIELLPGGAFEIYFLMDNPIGMRGSEGCKILSYLPNKMLTFSWNTPPNFAEQRASGYFTWVVIFFEEINSTTSSLQLTHYGWPEDETWKPIYDYFEKAWDNVLQNLLESMRYNG